jgi:hypothetical protein
MMTTRFDRLSLQASSEQWLRQGGRTTKAVAEAVAGGVKSFVPQSIVA